MTIDVSEFAKSGSGNSSRNAPSSKCFKLMDSEGKETFEVRINEFAGLAFKMAGSKGDSAGYIAKAGRTLDDQLPSGFSWKQAVSDMKADITPDIVEAIEDAQREILRALVEAGRDNGVEFDDEITEILEK